MTGLCGWSGKPGGGGTGCSGGGSLRIKGVSVLGGTIMKSTGKSMIFVRWHPGNTDATTTAMMSTTCPVSAITNDFR